MAVCALQSGEPSGFSAYKTGCLSRQSQYGTQCLLSSNAWRVLDLQFRMEGRRYSIPVLADYGGGTGSSSSSNRVVALTSRSREQQANADNFSSRLLYNALASQICATLDGGSSHLSWAFQAPSLPIKLTLRFTTTVRKQKKH